MLLDEAIVKQYVRFDTPVDQILSDPQISDRFHRAVNAQLPDESQVDAISINKRLLSLRKRGEKKGGLPRLRRSYHGRSA